MEREDYREVNKYNQSETNKYSSEIVKKGLKLAKQLVKKSEITLQKKETKPSACDSYLSLLSLGVENYKLSCFDLAIDYFNKAIDVNQDSWEAIFFRGFAYSILGNQKASNDDLYLGVRVFSERRDCILSLYEKACIMASIQAKESALKYYHDLLKIEPNYDSTYFFFELFIQGVVYHLLQNQSSALEKLNKTLEVSQNFVSALVLRGEIHYSLANYKYAIKDLSYALQLNPQHLNIENTSYMIGYCHLFCEEYQSAIHNFDKALNLNPNLHYALYNRGLSHYKLGNIEKAIEDYEKSLTTCPDFILAYINMGVAYCDLREYKISEYYYSQALNIDPSCEIAYRNRSIVRKEVGNFRGAREDWQKAQQLSQDSFSN